MRDIIGMIVCIVLIVILCGVNVYATLEKEKVRKATNTKMEEVLQAAVEKSVRQSVQVLDQFGSVTIFYETGADCAVVLEDRYVFIKYADGRIVRIRGNITTIVKSKEEGK